jgi:hypothetical protein
MGRYVTSRYSTEFNSTLRSIRWCGPTGLTLIRQHCTIGLNKSMNLPSVPVSGNSHPRRPPTAPKQGAASERSHRRARCASPLGFKGNESRNSDRSGARIEHKANPHIAHGLQPVPGPGVRYVGGCTAPGQSTTVLSAMSLSVSSASPETRRRLSPVLRGGIRQAPETMSPRASQGSQNPMEHHEPGLGDRGIYITLEKALVLFR